MNIDFDPRSIPLLAISIVCFMLSLCCIYSLGKTFGKERLAFSPYMTKYDCLANFIIATACFAPGMLIVTKSYFPERIIGLFIIQMLLTIAFFRKFRSTSK